MENKFFTFNQNNSGGRFVVDKSEGICECVIIEAKNAEQANEIAEKIGIYFNGVDNDRDCPCCGDRWYDVDDRDGKDEPSFYGDPISKATASLFVDNVFVHYLDGTFKEFKLKGN